MIIHLSKKKHVKTQQRKANQEEIDLQFKSRFIKHLIGRPISSYKKKPDDQ